MVHLDVEVLVFVGVPAAQRLHHVDDGLPDVVVAVAVDDGIHGAVDERQQADDSVHPGGQPSRVDEDVDEHRHEHGQPRQLEVHEHDGDGDELPLATHPRLGAGPVPPDAQRPDELNERWHLQLLRRVVGLLGVAARASATPAPATAPVSVVLAALVPLHAEARRADAAVQPRVTARLRQDAPVERDGAPQRHDEAGPDDDEHVVGRVRLAARAPALARAPAERRQHAEHGGVRPHEGDGAGRPATRHAHRVLERVDDGDVAVDGDGEDVGDGREAQRERRRAAVDARRVAVEDGRRHDEIDRDDQ